MKEPMREAIEKAAKSRGVSMNSEVVTRLESSFAGLDALSAISQDEQLGQFILDLIRVKGLIEDYGDTSIWKDQNAFNSFLEAISEIRMQGNV